MVLLSGVIRVNPGTEDILVKKAPMSLDWNAQTALNVGDEIVDILDQKSLIDGIREPRVNEGTSGHSSIDTDTTSRRDTRRSKGPDQHSETTLITL